MLKNPLGCQKLSGGTFTFEEKKSYSIFLQDKIAPSTPIVYEEQMEKSSKANPIVRNLANFEANRHVIWRSIKTNSIESNKVASDHKTMELRAATYEVLIDDIKVHEEKLRHGGVYSLVMSGSSNGTIVTRMYEVIPPNSMNILWLIPQYVVMTLGEVMFSVTGLEFSYSQAPVSMKSVLQACWLLTVAFGNVIVVIVAELKFFKSQASEFFLFSGLMFVDMLIFVWVAYRYQPNNPLSVSKLELNNGSGSLGESPTSRIVYQQQQPPTNRAARYTKKQQMD